MKSASKTTVFLMELTLAILIFSIAAAVCMKVFSTAMQFSARGQDLSSAVVAAESAAEAWKASGADPETAAALLGGRCEGEAVQVFYDENWQVQQEGTRSLLLTAEGAAAQITVARQEETLYTLSAKAPEGEAHG